MSSRIDKQELIGRVSRRMGREIDVEELADATLEEIYQALKQGECVSLRNFGTIHVRPERPSWVFRVNPSQRVHKLFGWPST